MITILILNVNNKLINVYFGKNSLNRTRITTKMNANHEYGLTHEVNWLFTIPYY